MDRQPLAGRLEAAIGDLTPSHRRVAEYIRSHWDRAAFLTAKRLGEAAGVSESTVVRFARTLGYDGYPALQKEMQRGIRARITPRERLRRTLDTVEDEAQVLEVVLRTDVHNIERTLEDVSPAAFTAVVDEIVRARRIYLVGLRSATALSYYFGFYLNLVLGNVTSLHGEGGLFEHLTAMGEDDLVIALSFQRYSSLTLEFVEAARSRGVVTIAITDSMLSPIAERADRVLLTRTNLVSFADSLVAPLSLLNALLTAVARREKDRFQQVLADLETIWAEHQVYLPSPKDFD